jgi:hypothetical protein
VDIYWLMEAAPDEAQAYDCLDETLIEDAAKVRGEQLGTTEGGVWSPPPEGSPEELMFSIAVEARALDVTLWHERGRGAPDDPDKDYRVDGEHPVFLIPRIAFDRPGKPPYTFQTFRRRGLLHHRIFPCEIGGAAVSLVAVPRTQSWRDEIVVGSGLFKDLTLKTEPVGASRFLVTDVTCPDQETQFRDHVERSVAETRCLAVIWPELTLTPAAQEPAVKFYKDLSKVPDAKTPSIVIMGSWHEAVGDKHQNVARVYSGYGVELVRYAKMRKFTYKGREEAIEMGRGLPILMVDDLLVALGICKDFCDRNRNSYRKLDVDLVLVPSFGAPKTMNHHILTATELQVQYGALTFVAQQASEKPPTGQGWIADMIVDPVDIKASDLVKPEGFQTYFRPMGWTNS